MKKLAKVLSLALVLVMVLSLGGTAWADVTVTVTAETITDQGGGEHPHTFQAFQLFTGEQSAEQSNKELENIQWGSALSSDALKNKFISAVNTVYGSATGLVTVDTSTTPATGSTAAEVADVISTFDTAQAEQFAKKLDEYFKDLMGTSLSESTTLATGYYLIVDKTTIEDGDARNASLLQLTEDITVAVKTDIPSQVKKVQDNEDGVTSQNHVEFNSNVNGPEITAGEGYNDVADYHIGDSVPFEILSRIPNMHYYEEYFFQFHDKMDDGLTLDPQSFTITIGSYTLSADELRGVYGSGNESPKPCDFHITFDDLKNFVGRHLAAINPTKATEYSQYNTDNNLSPSDEDYKTLTVDDMVGLPIRITFNAILNEDAEIGNAVGNVNTSQLEFSNNPDSDGHGKTAEDKVIVFTYKLENEKYSGRTTVLSDSAVYYSSAENMIGNVDGSTAQGSNTYATDSGKNYVLIDGKWHELLADAKFVLERDGKIAIFHNTNDGQKIVGWTTKYSANDIKTELAKDTPTKTFDAMNVAEFRTEIDEDDHTSWEINKLLEIVDPATVTLLMTSNAAGYFEAIGLDEGTYTLKEVVAPAGYNPITGGKEFTITATEIDDRQAWNDGDSTKAITKLELTIDGGDTTTQDVTNGLVKFGVENNQGTPLPETGGVGTTLFYVFGSMLVIAAAVYFVTKKRSEVE